MNVSAPERTIDRPFAETELQNSYERTGYEKNSDEVDEHERRAECIGGSNQNAVQTKIAIWLACRKVTAGPVLAPFWWCTKLQPGSITQNKM